MTKLAIVGAGTAGCMTVLHFLHYTDWEISWYYDSNIKPQPVGEGSTLDFCHSLWKGMGFTSHDIEKIDGSMKFGIRKLNWGLKNKDFTHFFTPASYSLHFNASKLQAYVMSKMQDNNRVRIFDQNIKSAYDVDADFVMFCSGKPDKYDDFYISECIPVNSVHVTQCWWDRPKFNYTLCYARPHGWVFGIPLTNRCSIGYLYNKNYSTLEEVKQDSQQIFKEFNLEPSDTTNSFSFGNYYRKRNFQDHRVAYNGNASFFLEPLEATSINTIEWTNRLAYDVWVDNHSPIDVSLRYIKKLREVENVIALHYAAGSVYENDFWRYAKTIGSKNISDSFKNNSVFSSLVRETLKKSPENYWWELDLEEKINYGTWSGFSFSTNLHHLGFRFDL